eukprot:2775392-Karenia_brevis.AAC.1
MGPKAPKRPRGSRGLSGPRCPMGAKSPVGNKVPRRFQRNAMAKRTRALNCAYPVGFLHQA